LVEKHLKSGNGSTPLLPGLPEEFGFHGVVNGVEHQVPGLEQMWRDRGVIYLWDHPNGGAVDEDVGFFKDFP
jgi:hypothetical protein